eukprot:gene34842-42194_t
MGWRLSAVNSLVSTKSTARQAANKNPFSLENIFNTKIDTSILNAVKVPNFSPPVPKEKEEFVDALVVGSGISGSTAAFYLNKLGANVLLTEARDVVGGNLISKQVDGFLWEEGPNSFQPNPAILRLGKDLGMIDELVLADPTLPRFVFWEGKLFALPGGIGDLVNFNLISWPGKIRAGLGALGLVSPPPAQEESVQDWVTRHLGAEVFDKVIDPFVSGVYAGDPRKLSMRAALKKVRNLEDLGVTRGILDGAIVRIQQLAAERKRNAERDADLPKVPGGALGSFKRGLQSLPLKIQEILGSRVRLGHQLVKIEKKQDGTYTCLFRTAKGEKQIRTRALLLTAPAHVATEVLAASPTLASPSFTPLSQVVYPPVYSVTLAYPTSAFANTPLKGFGHLIPRKMKIRTLGTIWSSSLFPGRAPTGYEMLLSYIGGAQDPEIAKLSAEDVVKQVDSDIRKILLREDAPPPKVLGVRLWPRAIPQYDKGHLSILSSLEEGERKAGGGLFLGGNYRTGVAFGDCINFGAEIAKQIGDYLGVADENNEEETLVKSD